VSGDTGGAPPVNDKGQFIPPSELPPEDLNTDGATGPSPVNADPSSASILFTTSMMASLSIGGFAAHLFFN